MITDNYLKFKNRVRIYKSVYNSSSSDDEDLMVISLCQQIKDKQIDVKASASYGKENKHQISFQQSPFPSPEISQRPTTVATFKKAIENISPVNKHSEVKAKKKRQRTEKSEILTSSPYKEQKGGAEEKKNKSEERKDKPNKRQRKLNFGEAVKASEGNAKCIICFQSFDENWVQCLKCEG
ncbi:hypothetical protein FQA39_LY10756 [Lamprigera yunnana]|nr:hypothetical protein FQA39_LY10756 [Lamprigera yunnana]